jgi:adenylosuccinate lyase
MTKETIAAFIQTLEIPEADKARLTAMTPADYVGLAAQISMPELA